MHSKCSFVQSRITDDIGSVKDSRNEFLETLGQKRVPEQREEEIDQSKTR